MARSRVTGALLAACLIGLAAFAAAEDAAPTEAQAQMTTNFKAEDAKQVYIPTTTNDYGSMIYSLLEQQLNFIAAKDGADQEGSPLNLLTSMASWVHQAQTALFQMGPSEGSDGSSLQALPTSPFPDPLRPLLNVTGSWGNIIAGSHPDIVPEALIQALTELPFGPQLNNAALALPTFTDPLGKVNVTSNFGSALTLPGVPSAFAKGGGATLASTAAAVLAYRPCIVTDSATGASVNAQLIVVNPRLITSTVAGVAVTPKLIEIQPAVIKVKPVGVNVAPTGINVVPTLISVGPKVSVGYPATPKPATKAATKQSANSASASVASQSNAGQSSGR
jgi:hypothetical protein